ncbi:MAG TPA: phosphoglycerate dehydrogenase [Rhodospirillales bacterium]|nr:phosphoglycerate dehydrogenase [Rhodospirillales bacterium]HJO69036.1 phosphoglycerate dehydrogenase [Rhodospirillales bacterium]
MRAPNGRKPMAGRPKVLIAVNHFEWLDARFVRRLEDAGMEAVITPQDGLRTDEAMIAVIPGTFATIAGGEPYSEAVLAAADSLRAIARFGVGYDRVDLAAASARGIVVTGAFGTNHDAVADRAFGFMAALANNLFDEDVAMKAGRWEQRLHATLWQATTGIIGLGRIGQALARRCAGFEMRVLACETKPDAAFVKEFGIELVSLETLLRESDFVSVNAPLAPATEGLLSRERLALMKPSAYLINTSRGGLIDEEALAEVLRERRIAGAGLEVFRREPLIDSPLTALDNVLLAPHSATQTRESAEMTADVCIDCILAVARGESPKAEYVLNPEALGA